MTDDAPQGRAPDPTIAAELGKLLFELGHGKESREDIGRVIRKHKPDSPHAAAFADIEMKERQEAWEKKQEEERQKQKQEEFAARLTAQRQRLIDGDEGGRKYTEDDVKKIEALMEKKGVFDYEDGAVLYSATLPPITRPEDEPPAPNSRTWEIPDFERYAKDPNRAAQETAYAMIRDFSRQRKRA